MFFVVFCTELTSASLLVGSVYQIRLCAHGLLASDDILVCFMHGGGGGVLCMGGM